VLHIRNDIPDPTSDEEAYEVQRRLAREVRLGERFRTVAGVAVAYSNDGERVYVAATVLSTTNWRPVSQQLVQPPVTRPYEAGMLEWGEAPAMVEALTRLPVEPDLIVVDGSGIAHPRKFGTACHVGYTLDHATVGVTELWPTGCRDIAATVEKRRGNKTALLHEVSGDKLGYQVYTQNVLDPIFVSPGHRVNVEDAASLILRCTPWHRMPEPLRAAREAADKFRTEGEA
jgi:deoxyribonuclease V